MFHVVLILFPLILCGIILPILLFGFFSVLVSVFGGAGSAVLIKNRKARSLLFTGFAILSLVGFFCLFPFIGIYTPLPIDYYSFVFSVLAALIGVFSILGILQSLSIQNKMIKILIISCFSFVAALAGIFFLIQLF